MVKPITLLTGVVFAIAVASGPALACKGQNVLFEDNFQEEDPAWGISEGVFVANGKMHLKQEPGYILRALNQGTMFEDADICVDVTSPNLGGNIDGGLMFWGEDPSNAYIVRINPEGYATVTRFQNNKWLHPVPWRKTDMVKSGPGATNNLRVTLKGNQATVYINDKRFAALKGIPPKGGSFIGLYSSSDKEPAEWLFDNLKVTNAP